jgi:hypothetical protein
MLLRGEAESGGEVPRIAKVAHFAGSRRHDGGCGQPPKAGDRQQRGAGGGLPRHSVKSRSSCAMRTSSNRISSTSNVIVPRISVGNRRSGVGEHAPHLLNAEALHCAMIMPNSRQKPRSALMREVRVAIYKDGCDAALAAPVARSISLAPARFRDRVPLRPVRRHLPHRSCCT